MTRPTHDFTRCTCVTDPEQDMFRVSAAARNRNRVAVGLEPLSDIPDWVFHRMTSEAEEQARRNAVR